MDMNDKDKKEQIKTSAREISATEQRIEFEKAAAASEGGEPRPNSFGREKKEISKDEKIIADELRREIEIMEVEDELKEQAKKKAQEIEFLGEKEKIEHLLKIAREKGIVFAIKIAKEMKDAYILDTLHDILAKEGYYKNFAK